MAPDMTVGDVIGQIIWAFQVWKDPLSASVAAMVAGVLLAALFHGLLGGGDD